MGTSISPSDRSPPNPPPSSLRTPDDVSLSYAKYAKIRYRAYLALLVVCPLVIVMPPRRLNFNTMGLAGVWFYALDEIVAQHRNPIPWMQSSVHNSPNSVPVPPTPVKEHGEGDGR